MIIFNLQFNDCSEHKLWTTKRTNQYRLETVGNCVQTLAHFYRFERISLSLLLACDAPQFLLYGLGSSFSVLLCLFFLHPIHIKVWTNIKKLSAWHLFMWRYSIFFCCWKILKFSIKLKHSKYMMMINAIY